MTKELTLHKMTGQHANQVASLHIQGISIGFISSLGQEFVAAMYKAVAEDKNSFGFVAIENDKTVGFVAFSTNLSNLYKHVILKKALKFIFVLAKKMLSLQTVKKVWDNFLYPSKMKKMNLPDAELLSIVVIPECRGRRIAKQLVDAGLEECRKRKIDKVKVLVGTSNDAANKLYLKCGFESASQIDSHGVKSNIYVAQM
jgi:ribosomal protein S18 acetylase RimI-like enzyme